MAENKTDYTKPHTDLIELLPEPLQSDVNLSIFGNIFNRYLTKQEIEKIAGYIGSGNPNALRSRQIHETDVHRQAYQLQPIPYNKIGSIEHMTSWKDMQNELERLGVDIDDFDDWGTTQKFNWVPPIDINKIINYRDYYWVDKDEPNSTPQYITIRNTCATAAARFNFWEALTVQFGTTMPIVELRPATVTPTTFKITEFAAADTLKVTGDLTDEILLGDHIEVINSTANDGVHTVSVVPVYSGVTNETTIKVSTILVVGSPVPDAKLALRRFNKVVLNANDTLESGDYTGLYEEGFIFFVRTSTNTDLNNAFVKVIESTYDSFLKQTTVTIDHRVTDETATGEASLEEQLSIFETDMKCQCGDFGGWDISLWDDNPLDPLWGDDESLAGSPIPDGISDHTNLITRISRITTPISGVGVEGELWYDISNDILYQANAAIDWVIIWKNFSLILDRTTGIDLWDMSLSCDTRPRIDATSQWINQNHWAHKNDVINFSTVTRASLPIIEYDWDLELNEWTYINYNWSYRAENEIEFEASTITPPRIELEPLVWWEHGAGASIDETITFDDRYGDLTDYFIPDMQVVFVDNLLKSTYTVVSSSYKTSDAATPGDNEFPYRTFVEFEKVPPIFTVDAAIVKENLTIPSPNAISIIPLNTVFGDAWEDYNIHWRFDGSDDSVPVPHQNLNPYMDIDVTQTVTPVYGAGSPLIADYNLSAGSPTNTLVYEYTTSLYAQNYLLSQPTTKFLLVDGMTTTGSQAVPITSHSLTRRALFGYDDMRVYASDFVGENVVREFGTYDEIGEVVFDIRGVTFPNKFRIGDSSLQDFEAGGSPSLFSTGDKIKVSDNISIIAQEFTVVSASGELITVSETIPAEITEFGFSGNITNVTNPIRPEDGGGFTNTESITVYAVGAEFPTTQPAGTNVRIIVGASSVNEIGTGNINVLTSNGTQSISTTSYRIVEQIKTKTNQYPLFDVFTVEGLPAYKVSSIFGYRASGAEEINHSVGLRIIYDALNDIYEFDQFLLNEDDGELFAYRDYANKQNDYWFNKETSELKFWDDIHWSDKTTMSEYYRRAIISPTEPNGGDLDINDLYWYNTITDTLFRRFTATRSWIEIPDVDHLVTDANLQTIWRAGKNNDVYIPDEVDWTRRSETEYNDERDEFIATRSLELVTNNPSISEGDVLVQATNEWHESQANHISPTGVWVGDWEIPDPLYYNHMHKNKKYLSSRELLTHFTTIINAQELVPGWSGTKDGQFNIVHINDINYGVGGTIKEFNNGFDTLISSVMVNNVTPPSLFEFAHDQYEVLLNSIKEIYRKNSVELLTDVTTENILNVSRAMADSIIGLYELNDNSAFLYGDSTTFTDNAGTADTGVRNWIATLPYLNLVHRVLPERTIDSIRGINEVLHHDGHRDSYAVTKATADIISKTVINSPDPRISNETLGTESTLQPAKDIVDFMTAYTTISNRKGVYWYHTSPNPSTLYRYTVIASSDTPPPTTYDNDTLWMDLTTGLEVLRILRTDTFGVKTWNVVDGLSIGDGRLHNGTNPADVTTATVSAWQITNLDVILGDIIFELENRLYENVADTIILNYDFDATKANHTSKYLQYTQEAFLSHVSQSEIEEPLKNNEFDSTDPFTWNYKRSATGGSVSIISADDLTNSFVVAGNKTSIFTNWVYVKNSTTNDGRWDITSSAYDASLNSTTIYVNGDVKNDILGIIYTGKLPSPIDPTFTPNNLNDGSESGGHWRDLYEKIYGTPYPHTEPWILQGYTSKPSWWDGEYLNNNIAKWGDRTWKYKHGFDIIGFDNDTGSPAVQSMSINGEFYTVFVSGQLLFVDNTTTPLSYNIVSLETIQSVSHGAAGTATLTVTDTGFASTTYIVDAKISIVDATNKIAHNYIIKNTNLVGTDLTIIVEEEILPGDINVGTDYINGVVYIPTTNKTTIYVSTPVNVSSSPIDGRISVTYGMWENIRLGRIPTGRSYPNGIVSVTGIPSSEVGLSVDPLPTFNYFSVNIDNVVVSSDGGITNYLPDAILPPYWDLTEMYGILSNVLDIMVRSLYITFSNEIISPNANYTFNDRGPVEWEWKASSQWLYDQLTIAYRLDPSCLIYSTFGFNFTTIGGLLIDRDVRNTASHTRTNFHGDVVDDTQFISNGINQWYVNFNRYTGYDTNFSDFQSLWTQWYGPLTYQFTSYIDTPALSVAHRYVELTNFDYNITSKRSAGLGDFWLDAFDIQIINIPYDIVRYNNQLDWRFEIKTNISQSRKIEYYDVHNYQFHANPTTNECSIYTWNIQVVNSFDNAFDIVGDHEDLFAHGRQFIVSESSGNDDTYVVDFVSYDAVTKITTITVNGNVPSPISDGKIKLDYRDLPWETGFPVYLSTTETMPIPLDSDTVIGTTKYFIIKTSPTTFKIANTYDDSLIGTEISLATKGIGDHYVGELSSTFTTSGSGDVLWRQYVIDKTNTLALSTPKQIQGMQRLIDIVRGYDSFADDSGWVVNADRASRDPDTDDIVTWHLETERFINYAYNTRTRRAKINNKYIVTANATTDEFLFASDNRVFITGDPVMMLSSNGLYPTPLSPGLTYYIIRDELDTFKLAASRHDAKTGVAIDLQLTAGVGELSILTPTEGRFLIPSFEMNPFRNAVWFRPPSGIVSNVITGPSDDIRTSQLIFDQNGDSIHVDQLRVYRKDKETKIAIKDAVNTKPTISFINDDYNFLHLGGLHIFTDSYEHVMLFNNYSAGENLLYDPFIGLNVTKYEMLFNRNPEFTGRPNVGGYYLETFFNQGANIKENFEAGVENLRNAYDTYDTLESNTMTTFSRDSLGYDGVENFLTDLNISEKSQFIFWRGQIQAKGSINAIKAYINSRRFIDAKLDEFWAIKVADFGSSKEKEYPEMFTTTVDARTNEFKVEFISSEDEGMGVSEGFTPIRMSDTDRWYNQPEQLEVLRNNGKLMYFDMKIVNKLEGIGSPSAITMTGDGYIVHNLDADVVEVTNTLGEQEGFEYINPNVIKMTSSPLPTPTDLTIWGYVVNNDAQNPSRLIDTGSETQLSTIEFWDPARGHHYSLAIHNVDLQNYNDPAVYVTTPQTITDTRTWSSEYVGTSWMDTSTMDYVPYHSDKVITNDSVRFREWGQLYDYASINLYEWVESNIPPSEWDAIAATEEGDNTIPEAERKAGVAKFTLFENVGADWVPVKNKADTQYAALNLSGVFTIDLSIIDNTKAIDVYINESKQTSVGVVGSPAILPLTVSLTVKENDIVKFVQSAPTDAAEIAALLSGSPATYKQEYEYTTTQEYDSFGALSSKYYFWVGNKGTKPLDRNRLMALAEAQQQLVSVPSAHMFFQKPSTEEEIVDSGNLVNRTEYFTASVDGLGSPPEHIYNLNLVANENSTITVDINGMAVAAEDITYVTETEPAGLLAPAWDINTATLSTNATFTEQISREGMVFGDNGTKMYIIGLDLSIVSQYTVGTPYDVTTAVYASKSFSVVPEEVSPQDVKFNPDGTKMYICGNDSHITQYTLNTAWDVSTAITPVDGSIDPSGWPVGGMHFNAAGTKVYIVIHNFGSTSYIYAQTLLTPWEISSIQSGGTYMNISSETGYGTGIHVSGDGNYIHISSSDNAAEGIFQYTLSTPFDETSIAFDVYLDTNIEDDQPVGVTFNPTGTEMYFMGGQTNTVYVYDIDTGGGGTPVGIETDQEITTVTINQPVVAGTLDQEVRISYVGTYTTTLPNRFSQVIIRGLQGIVFDDSRYTIRFNRDFTLRDTLDVVNEEIAPLDLNNLHEEWKIFRKEQESKIDRWMWDKITESIVGYLLTDTTVRVPSYEYELYDDKHGTDTQYGIGVNQSFVNGVLALSSIIAYLEDSDVVFTPIDINTFFNNYNFDTAENIIVAMDNIYNTFNVVNINRIYFSVLFDAFTTKAKYPGIFKTSMVSLHGIRPFQEQGFFDD